jgi:hypothetical protein
MLGISKKFEIQLTSEVGIFGNEHIFKTLMAMYRERESLILLTHCWKASGRLLANVFVFDILLYSSFFRE